MKKWFVTNWFTDINRGFEAALNYKKIDMYSLNVLWIHFFVFTVLALLNSYLKLALLYPTPLSLRVIPEAYATLVIIIAFIASAIPAILQSRIKNHYLFRLLIAFCLTMYTFLFIFISGGSIEMYFHFFIVIAYIAIYVDWRLGWVVFLLALIHHTLFDIYAPHWLFYYGHSVVAPLIHGLAIAITALLTTYLCKSLRSALIEQKNLEQRKDEFISMTSHELKTPLTSITLFLTVLEQKLHKKRVKEYDPLLTKVDYQLTKLSKLIKDLLDVSRLQTNKLDFEFDSINLNDSIVQTVENIMLTNPSHTIEIEGKARRKVYADPHRITQVLENILLNAIKYSPEQTSIIISLTQTKTAVTVSVSDQGIGIDKKHHNSIFERFYRVYEDEEKTFPGMGIGLYISYSIIKNHGGDMWVESEKGRGATFFFTLPYNNTQKKKNTKRKVL